MKKIETQFKGLFLMETDLFQDERGGFQKIFNCDFFKESKLEYDFKEFYYSINNRDVIRGMHFQLPPHDHAKVVYVSNGSIIDVVIDIRKNSKTYGQCFSKELCAANPEYLYIPRGFAHGFLSSEDNTIVNYAQTSCYSKEHDCGIASDSIGFDWNISQPIRSERDIKFPSLSDFKSPF